MTDENLTGLDLTENDLIQLCSSFQNELSIEWSQIAVACF